MFGGFKKCVFAYQAFQSDDERRFAVLIDLHEAGVSRWVKPGTGQFRIEYRRGQSYEPDFVVETASEKLIVEIKALRDMETETVQAKSKAVATWIGYANRHAAANSGKYWRYLLVPHDRMTESASLAGLAASFSVAAVQADETEAEASFNAQDSTKTVSALSRYAELERVRLAHPVSAFYEPGERGFTTDREVPAGANGTIVTVLGQGQGYEIEFVEPFAAIATVQDADLD